MKVIDIDDMESVKFTEQRYRQGRDDVIAYQAGWNEAIESIVENAPNIDIVRCGECEWYDIDNEGVPYCSFVSGMCGDVTPLDFCSRGERKDDEDD